MFYALFIARLCETERTYSFTQVGFISLLLLLLFYQPLAAQWTNLDSGINDELTGIVFIDDLGVVTGGNGLYYTLTGGVGSDSWQRFTITDNSELATLYNNTHFTECTTDYRTTPSPFDDFTVYACGYDRVNERAVLMSIDLPSLNYQIVSIDIDNSRLEDIQYNDFRYYAVGNSGLVVRFFSNVNTYEVIDVGLPAEDFTSIDFREQAGDPCIGGDGRYFMMDIGDDHSIQSYTTSGEALRDVRYVDDNEIYAVNDKYLEFAGSFKEEHTDYDFGPLNANTIFLYQFTNFIGTDHGIFSSRNPGTILEWHPSSGTHNINAFWKRRNSSTLYACGSDGVVLLNESPYADRKPYVRILYDGGCFLGEPQRLEAIVSSSSSCNWFVNDALKSTNCTSFFYNFPEVGSYEIRLVVEYSGHTTEQVKNVQLAVPPEPDKPFTVPDTVICKSGPIEITVDDTQVDVRYTLRKVGDDNSYGSSPVGNGGTITFHSTALTETGQYYLSADRIDADCRVDFSEQFGLLVEKTKADFSTSLLNALPGQQIQMYDNSTDAQQYEWTFIPDGNPAISTERDPEVAYTDTGQTFIKLKSTSEFGCTDSIFRLSSEVYTVPPDLGNCWMLNYTSEDPPWIGGLSAEIVQMTPISDGFLVCGYYNNTTFDSKAGRTYTYGLRPGAYLAKYTLDGVIQWVVNTDWPESPDRDQFFSAVEDLEGNIYVGGYSRNL